MYICHTLILVEDYRRNNSSYIQKKITQKFCSQEKLSLCAIYSVVINICLILLST